MDHGPFEILDGSKRAKRHGMNAQAVELERRFMAFAAQIIALSTKMPKTREGRHIGSQVLRSGTATAANYGEARGAESRSDFIHKLGVVLKELNETVIWLELIGKSALLPMEVVQPIIAENRELCRIITASLKTARGPLNNSLHR